VTETLRRSILVIEDDPLVAMDLEVVLNASGYRVIGPGETTEEALKLLHEETPDVAVLDLNLGTEMSFPLFDYLERIGVPFVVLSGHSRNMVPARHIHSSFVQKPYAPRALLQVISTLLDKGDGATARQAC
jgi:DNA-binding response OmpR family regulator